MSNTAFQFNAMQYEPIGPAVELWPDGWVKVVGTEIEIKPNAGNTSGRISMQIKALEGPMNGKIHFIGLNVFHDNPQTVEIANRQLSAITYVTIGAMKGQYQFQDLRELLNIPFYVMAQNKTDEKNVTRTNFVAFRDVNGNEPKGQGQGSGAAPSFGGPPAQQPPPQQQQQPGGWQQPQQPQQQQPQNPAPPSPAGGGWQAPQNPNPAPAPGGWAPPNNAPPANGAPPNNAPPQQQQPWNAGGGQQQQTDAAPWRK